MPFKRPTKDQARQRMIDLVAKYQKVAADVERKNSPYNEAQARSHYIDDFLQLFGWDVRNDEGLPDRKLEVIVERTQHESAAISGRPDYRLRINEIDRLPVEAKKPSVNISDDTSGWARQAHAYGYSMRLPAAVLINVRETVICDSTQTVDPSGGGYVPTRMGCRWTVNEYVDRFDEMWAKLSWEVLSTVAFYDAFDYEEPARGKAPFDRDFLVDFRDWRLALARDIAKDATLSMREVGRRTQQVLNALLFLRVYEARHDALYEQLKKSAESETLDATFRAADKMFNASIFVGLIRYKVSANVLKSIVLDMYYPKTKYAFGVLEAWTLASVYEQYLAQDLERDLLGTVILRQKPEYTHANGIVTTPQGIVDALLDEVMGDLSKTAADMLLIDPASGSGIFLLTALNRLIIHEEQKTRESVPLFRRAQLVVEHLFGVDIDAEAVEVARLGLLLTVLGDEQPTPQTVGLLPDLTQNVRLGNSIVGEDFDQLMPDVAGDPDRRVAVSPFNWQIKFPAVFARGGFTAVVGNPPYIRIQELKKHFNDQVRYWRDKNSQFCSPSGNFDAYMLFLERAIHLVAARGRVAFIVQNRFMNASSAAKLRTILAGRVEKIVHFGVHPLFEKRSTYSALVILSDGSLDEVQLDQVGDPRQWFIDRSSTTAMIPRNMLTSKPWPLISQELVEVFEQMAKDSPGVLGGPTGWCRIYVGVQTSADDLYLVKPMPESTERLVVFKDKRGRKWEIERSITVPALLDLPIRPYDSRPEADRVSIFPYQVLSDEKGKITATVFDLAAMAETYPLALAYFENWYDDLVPPKRDLQGIGPEYWRYGRSQNITRINVPKLIVRTMTLQPAQAYDPVGTLGTGGGNGGPYTMLTPNEICKYGYEVLQAILTHPAVDAFVKSRASTFQGGYFPHREATMKDVPLPLLSDVQQKIIINYVVELREIVLRQRSDSARTEPQVQSDEARARILAKQVEDLITSAYGLTEAHIASLK